MGELAGQSAIGVGEEPTGRIAPSVDRAAPTAAGQPAAAAPDVSQLGVPSRLGRYQVVRRLGAGGMAEVFLAERVWGRFTKRVVLKRVLPHLVAHKRFRDALEREARISALLKHPNLVETIDFDEEEGAAFIVMEYVEGLTLRALAHHTWDRSGALPLHLVVHAIADAALGLDHAHQATDLDGQPLGVVHRDISPDNLQLGRDGSCRVLDFGIVKTTGSTSLTATGEVKGKLAFMPPEQIEGAELDSRADLYSLGVSLYWLLTGRRPFEAPGSSSMGAHSIMLATAVQTEVPRSPGELNDHVPPDVDDLVMQLLEKKPEHRVQTGAEVSDRLRAAVHPRAGRTAAFVRAALDDREGEADVALAVEATMMLPHGVRACVAEDVPATVGPARRARSSFSRSRGDPPLAAWLGVGATTLLVGLVAGFWMGGSDETPASSSTVAVAATADPTDADPTNGDPARDARADDAQATPGAAQAPTAAALSEPTKAEPAKAEPAKAEPTKAEPRKKAAASATKRRTVRLKAPSHIRWKSSSGRKLGKGSARVQLSRSDTRVVAVDTRRGATHSFAVASTINYASLPTGQLDVVAFPYAEVSLGSKKIGTTPLDRPLRLPVGTYRVRLRFEDRTETRKVVVEAGRTERVKVRFD